MSEITRAQLGLAPRDSVLLALKSVATMALADGLGLKHIEHLFRLAVVSQAMEQSSYNSKAVRPDCSRCTATRLEGYSMIRTKTPAEKSARTRRLKQKHATWAQFPTARLVVDDRWRKVYEGGREVLNCKTELGRQAYKIRTLMMAERQGWICGLTGEQLTAENVTFDHERGRCAGRRDDRIELPNGQWINAAVTWKANSEKGSKRVPYLPHATKGMQ